MGVTHSQGQRREDCICGVPCCDGFAAKPTIGRRKRVLLTGASGLLGRQIMKLDPIRWEIRGLYSSRPADNLVYCDLLREGEIEKQFLEYRPDAVIHSAAERRPDVVHKQPDKAHALNVNVTKELADCCKKHNAWLVYFSTDYIFDGEHPPYEVDAEARPLSAYGEQKRAGEELCLEICPESSAVLRVPLLYGPMEYVKESGVTSLFAELQKGVRKADHTQKRYPTFTVDVARIIERMLEVHFSGRKLLGVYHWQSEEQLSKYDMMVAVASLFEMDGSEIEASLAAPKFPRPEDSRLDCSRLVEELNIDPANYRTLFSEGLACCFKSFPKDVLACEMRDRMDPELQLELSKEDVQKMFKKMNINICDKTFQNLMNKSGKISKTDYMEWVQHHVGEA